MEIDQSKSMSMRDLNPQEEVRARLEPNDELEMVHIGAVAEKFTFIGRGLPKTIKAELTGLLRELGSFCKGIRRYACHRLAIDPKVRPVAQKKRKLKLEKSKVAMQETGKLLKTRFIGEIHSITWLANVVMVPKSLGK